MRTGGRPATPHRSVPSSRCRSPPNGSRRTPYGRQSRMSTSLKSSVRSSAAPLQLRAELRVPAARLGHRGVLAGREVHDHDLGGLSRARAGDPRTAARHGQVAAGWAERRGVVEAVDRARRLRRHAVHGHPRARAPCRPGSATKGPCAAHVPPGLLPCPGWVASEPREHPGRRPPRSRRCRRRCAPPR